jgi:hypothetical protein
VKQSEMAELMSVLTAAYPRQITGRNTLAVYAQALADLDPDEVREAVAEHVATSRFFPTIAEIRDSVFAAHPERTEGSSYPKCRDCDERLTADEMVDERCTELTDKGWRHYHCADQVVIAATS